MISVINIVYFTIMVICEHPNATTNKEVATIEFSSDPPLFWLDLSVLSYINKYISIIKYDADESEIGQEDYEILDFETTLINYIQKTSPIPLTIFTSQMMNASCSSCNEKNRDMILGKITENHLILIIYKSFSALNQTTANEDWIAFRSSKKSYFMIFVLEKNIEESPCESTDFLEIFKYKTGKYFEQIFSQLKIIEVTMIFPLMCQQEFMLKYDFRETFSNKDYSKGVSILDKGHFKNDPRVLLHDYSNFKKYPLKVNRFRRIPTLVDINSGFMNDTYMKKDTDETGNEVGLDGLAMGNVIKNFNFSPNIRISTDGGEYGYKDKSGQFSGSIGDIINRRMDISFNARFIKLYGTEDIEFTVPVFYDEFCVVVPKAQPVPTWMSIFLVFSIPVWIVIGLTFILSGFMWWLMKAKFARPPLKLSTTAQCFLFLDIFLVLTSQPWAVLPKIDKERFMLTICLIFNLIIAGLFQGYLSTAYSTTTFKKDISSLDELDESGLSISTKNTDIFGGANATHVGARLTKKIIPSQQDSWKIAANQGKTTVVERKTDAAQTIQFNYTSKDGQPKLHIVNECPRSYHLSYIVYKDFPFLNHLNRFLRRTVEAGLHDKWYYDTDFALLLKNRQREEAAESTKKLTMVDVQTSFWFLVISLLLSIIVFFTEMFIYYGGKLCLRCSRKKEKISRTVAEQKSENRDKTQYPFLF